jgi:hypothetical protein
MLCVVCLLCMCPFLQGVGGMTGVAPGASMIIRSRKGTAAVAADAVVAVVDTGG